MQLLSEGFGGKGPSLLVNVISDSALSVPLVPLLLVVLALRPYSESMVLAAVPFLSLMSAWELHRMAALNQSGAAPSPMGAAKLTRHIEAGLGIFLFSTSTFLLLNFTLDSLGHRVSQDPSWGAMVNEAIWRGAEWWRFTIPTLLIGMIAVSLIFLSNRLLLRGLWNPSVEKPSSTRSVPAPATVCFQTRPKTLTKLAFKQKKV